MSVRYGDRFRQGASPVAPSTSQSSDDDGVASLDAMLRALATLPYAEGDAARIDRMALLERLRGAVAAAQALEMVEFEESQIAEQRAAGVSERRVGRGVADQIGLARELSPARGSRELGWTRSLVKQMPQTRRLLAAGRISEVTARAMVTETAELEPLDRRRVDSDLAPDLPAMGEREARAAARKLAYSLDPEASTRRARKAREDRRVSIRPAPETMTLLTGLLPVEQGVAAYASLKKHASAAKAAGDERTRSQIMADTFVERLTGQQKATDVPIEVRLTMGSDTLFDEDDEPADVDGYGPVPADVARDLIRPASAEATVDPVGAAAGPSSAPTGTETYAGAAADPASAVRQRAGVWVRRLFDDPATGVATSIDPTRRRFTGAVARYLLARDQVCRTPGCGAPIRHLDHIRPYRDDGPTTVDNGQGLCERCSYTKEMPGWRTTVTTTAPHTTTITTPTGHTYASQAPPANGPGPSAQTLGERRRDRRLARLKSNLILAGLRPPDDPDP
ncbi:HNH endonuclease [Solicola gregarius]|uniref:DUF222 domain-containing protein n=1 Tax=Solicola gregarius TaxID=2908642 RepID=A0AA46TM94_9ACTN|nr:DUF222 domain-containing protein [Solicola gregarius]UYM07517.1 DUF222 domain-containing protein [Solicola gregarius]